MPRLIILNGTVPNDETGDNLRVTADKINSMFGEMYSVFQFQTNGDLKIHNPNGDITIGAGANGGTNPAITIPENNGGTIGIGNGTGSVRVGGSTSACPQIGVPPCGSTDAITIDPKNGGVKIGDPANPGINVPANGSGNPIKVGDSNSPVQVGGGTNPGITVPPSGSNSPINVGGSGFGQGSGGNGNGGLTLGDPANPAIEIGTAGVGGGNNISIKTNRPPFELLYTGSNGKLDSSQYVKVTADSADTEGKSLHLAASTYDLGFGNSVKQRAIYFTDPSLTGGDATAYPSKRVASIRWWDQGASEGLFLSPQFNYNDTAFANKGVGIWRFNDNGVAHTKVNLNADCDGPGTHGVQIGRGAIGFFQDLPSYVVNPTDAVKGLTYIVIPGIHTDDGTAYVGQISGNPYKNRDPAFPATKGIPYWSLGHKTTTQLIENAPAGGIEKSERTPGTEVITWTVQNRVGINNTNPQYTLDVTGDIHFDGKLLVDNSAGTSGQILTSGGAGASPAWLNIPPVNDLAGGTTGSIPYQSNVNDTAFLAPGTTGQVLKMGSGGVPEWGTAAGALSISSDSSGNVNYNLALTTASSGSISAQVVDAGKLKYNPSEKTGTLYSPNLVLSIPGSPLPETGYKEAYLYFRNPSGVNVSSINVYDDFYAGNVGYYEVYVRNGANEAFANLNFNGYGAFGFDDTFGNQGDVVVGYGATGKTRMARMGTGTAQLVSELPAASTAGAGARGFVTDATASTFYSVVAGGGSIGVPVFSDGTNWRIG